MRHVFKFITDVRDQPRILEIGDTPPVDTGWWDERFPGATVYTDHYRGEEFDVVVDDGMKRGEDGKKTEEDIMRTLDARIGIVSQGGYYAIENVRGWDPTATIEKWWEEGRHRDFVFNLHRDPSALLPPVLVAHRSKDRTRRPFQQILRDNRHHLEWIHRRPTCRQVFYDKLELVWETCRGQKTALLTGGTTGGTADGTATEYVILAMLLANPGMQITITEGQLPDEKEGTETDGVLDYMKRDFPRASFTVVSTCPSTADAFGAFDVVHVNASVKEDVHRALVINPVMLIVDGATDAARDLRLTVTAESSFPYRSVVAKVRDVAQTVSMTTAFFSIPNMSRDKSVYFAAGRRLLEAAPAISWTVFTNEQEELRSWGLPGNVVIAPMHFDQLCPLLDHVTGPASDNPAKDTVDYMRIQNSKGELVVAAALAANAEYAAWVDFGMLQYFHDTDESTGALLTQVSRQRYGSRLYMPGFRKPDIPLSLADAGPIWSFAGTFFVGKVASLVAFNALCKHTLSTLVREHGTMTWEINIWHDVAARNPGAVDFYQVVDHKRSLLEALLALVPY